MVKCRSKSNINENICFSQWLVGMVDGDGCFSFSKSSKDGYWRFYFRISQNIYNKDLLDKVQKYLTVGGVFSRKTGDLVTFSVSNREHLIEYIFPIFDKYPLLTYKYLLYQNFKKAVFLARDKPANWYSQVEALKKNSTKIVSIAKESKSGELLSSIKSPVWDKISGTLTKSKAERIMTKSWLVGFTEAEGSFFISGNESYMYHYFSVSQKHDGIVIESISLLLSLNFYASDRRFRAETQKITSIKKISRYFWGILQGKKELELQLWSESFHQWPSSNTVELKKVQLQMREIRNGNTGILKNLTK